MQNGVVFENGTVWTGAPGSPGTTGLALDGDRVAETPVSGARRVDLHGGFLAPGLIDAHTHVLGFGFSLERIQLAGTRSLAETLDRIREFIARESGDGEWIRGRGWDQNLWPGGRFPTARDLDAVTGDRPAALSRVDGHVYWVNSRALILAGISRETPDPPGGRLLRDDAGNPTGILIDAAKDPVVAVLPPTGAAARLRAIGAARSALARYGITTVHDMGMSAGELEVYRQLDPAVPGTRIYAAISAADPERDRVLAAGPDPEWGRAGFRLGMVKFFVDGALGSRGAALLEPYADEPDHTGLLLLSPEHLEQEMERALRAGFQCAVHAIGDRANRVALDAWDRLRDRGTPGPADRPPVRIEHAQLVHPEDLPRFGALGVTASVQPVHCLSDMPWMGDRVGTSRLRGAYAWRSLAAGGAMLCAGSDVPVESADPRPGLFALTARGDRGSGDSQALDRDAALAAFTRGPAAASGDLGRLGTLTPGSRADLVVFDRNLVTCEPEDLLEARPWLTLVGGEPVWVDPDSPFASAFPGMPA